MNKRTGSQNITRTRTTEHAINIMILNTNTHAHTHTHVGNTANTAAVRLHLLKGARDVLSSLISSTHVCAWLKISLRVALAARSPVQKLIATMKQGCSAQCGPGQGLWSWSPFLSLFFCDFGKKQTWKSNQNYSEHALQHWPEARPWMLFTLLWLVNSDSASSKVQFKQVHFTPEGWWLVWMQTRLFPLSFSISDCFIITPKELRACLHLSGTEFVCELSPYEHAHTTKGSGWSFSYDGQIVIS